MNALYFASAIPMLALVGCVRETPPVDSPAVPPDQILDFSSLYSQNCAGCHGRDGQGGAALPLGNPVYLAIASDAVIRTVTAKGVAGTAMPAFAQSSGGTLTDRQIDAIVQGIRTHWARPDVLGSEIPPPYAANVRGDVKQGAEVFVVYCSSCHGSSGRGSERVGSIVDPTYLALVSEQSLRTTIIAGRPDLGSPDWRSDVSGRPMSSQDVSDVVAWLESQGPRAPQGVGESQ